MARGGIVELIQTEMESHRLAPTGIIVALTVAFVRLVNGVETNTAASLMGWVKPDLMH